MARPPKQGLDYFPFDWDFYHSRKIRRILKTCGPAAGTVLTCLLGNIYYKEGYFIFLDEDLPFDIADLLGMSERQVMEVIEAAIKAKFFDEDMYSEFRILTSRGIQERYFCAISGLRRSKIEIIREYLISPHDVDNMEYCAVTSHVSIYKNQINANKNNENVIDNEINVNNNNSISCINSQTKLDHKKRNNTSDIEMNSKIIEEFIEEFERKYSVRFSCDNIAAFKNSVLKYLKEIEVQYYSLDIFLKTILKRMDDAERSKSINNPIHFFFSGAFGPKKFLWNLTQAEEKAGSGYHKPLIEQQLYVAFPGSGLLKTI